MPKHSHRVYDHRYSALAQQASQIGMEFMGENRTTNTYGLTTEVGGSEAHQNMPPYTTIYMWRRSA